LANHLEAKFLSYVHFRAGSCELGKMLQNKIKNNQIIHIYGEKLSQLSQPELNTNLCGNAMGHSLIDQEGQNSQVVHVIHLVFNPFH
jgi:hypothetical protein